LFRSSWTAWTVFNIAEVMTSATEKRREREGRAIMMEAEQRMVRGDSEGGGQEEKVEAETKGVYCTRVWV
jgi:hypothetical protein